ncbi:RnaseH-domain-containing protein [Trametes maxima]|nr:RnaseH-domain-containing protein [Trametes maxima]
MTKYLEKWESNGWIGVRNTELIQELAAVLRGRSAVTTFRWTKGHVGEPGNEGADRLAKDGALKPRPCGPLWAPPPKKYIVHGAALAKITQKLAYKGIITWKRRDLNPKTVNRAENACAEAAKVTGGIASTEALWKGLRREEFPRKIRDFIWKYLHGAHRVGRYWGNIPGYEERASCKSCGDEESVGHILTKCSEPCGRTAWGLCAALLRKRGIRMPELSIDLIMGISTIEHMDPKGRVNVGDTRLTRICVAETAYLLWVMRCERVIGGRSGERAHKEEETRNRWRDVINRRAQMDRSMTKSKIAGNWTLAERKVEETWRALLEKNGTLKRNITDIPGVLVGIPPALAWPP